MIPRQGGGRRVGVLLTGLAALVFLGLVPAHPTPASAADLMGHTSGEAELDDEGLGARLEQAPSPSPPTPGAATPGRPGGGGSGGRPGPEQAGSGGSTGEEGSRSRYVRVYVEERRAPAFRACPDGSVEVLVGILPDGRREVIDQWCAGMRPAMPPAAVPTAPVAAGADGATAPPLVPPPPTAAQVRDAVAVPVEAPAVDPRVDGLVGLPTHLWYEGDRRIAVTVTLGAYRVDAQAVATRFRWDLGDGTVHTTTDAGSPARPAVQHPYTVRGAHRITLTVDWTGSYTFAGPAGSATESLGTVSRTSTLDYTVRDAQAVRR